MQEILDWIVSALDVVPTETVYLLVGAGAAVENVFPPVPSDTFVVLGGVLASRNVPRLVRWFETANTGLLAGALLLFSAVGVWWWRTRRKDEGEDGA